MPSEVPRLDMQAAAPQARVRQSTILILATVAGWTLCAALLRNPLYDGLAVLSSVAILLASIFFFKWDPPKGREGFRLLGFFVCTQTFLSAGLSVIAQVDTSPFLFTPTVDAFSFSVEASVIFSLMFMVGAWFTSPGPGERLADEASAGSGPTPVAAIAIAVLTVLVNLNFALTPGTNVGRLGTLPLVLLNIGLLTPMVVAARLLKPGYSRAPIVIILLGQATITFYNSMLGIVVFTIRDMLLAHIYLRRRVPVVLIAVTAAIVLLLNPAKMVFRNMAGDQFSKGPVSFDQTTENWAEAVSATWSPSSRTPDRRIESTADRLNYNWLSAHVYLAVPSRVPYQMGRTLEDIPMVMTPRLLYPDKPTASGYTRSRWLVQLGIQDSRSVETTAVSLPAPAEAYWNFGWLGVFGVPAVLGLMVGAVLRISPRDPVARVGFVVLLATTLGQFLDMLVWIVPQFVTVAAAALLATAYCRVGRLLRSSRTANAKPLMRAQHEG